MQPAPPANAPPSITAAEHRARQIALYVLCGGMLMIVLDATVVNVALPKIRADLGFTPSSLAWVVNAYLIAFGGFLLLAGRIGDLLGRRRVFLAGLTTFTFASLACGLAGSETMLIVARFVQGLGGAMTSSVILGMIVTLFPEPRERAKAIGVYAFVASAGGAFGLLVGGALTQAISWHWIFFVNVPIGLITATLALRLLPDHKGLGFGAGADVPGAALVTSALMLGVYTIVVSAAQRGWTAGETLGLGAAALVLLAGFVLREHTAQRPLMPLRIFRSRNVAGANVIQVMTIAGMFGMFFLGAQYVQTILGYDALQTGLAFLPMTILMGTMSVRYSARLITRFGARTMVRTGLALFATGMALFTQIPVDGSYLLNVAPTMVLLGVGAGMCFPALMGLAMSSATPQDAGLSSGLINTMSQVGGALGLAVLATLAASKTETQKVAGVGVAQATVDGYHLAFWIAVGLVSTAFTVALIVLQKPPVAPKQGADGGDGDSLEDEAARLAEHEPELALAGA